MILYPVLSLGDNQAAACGLLHTAASLHKANSMEESECQMHFSLFQQVINMSPGLISKADWLYTIAPSCKPQAVEHLFLHVRFY